MRRMLDLKDWKQVLSLTLPAANVYDIYGP